MKRTTQMLSCLLALFIICSPLSASEKRPMTLVDLLEVPALRNPKLSPDGQQVVFELQEADWKANKRIGHLWLAQVDGGDPVQLTNGETGESGALFSPDGRSIAFLARRGDDEAGQIYLIPVDGGEAVRLTNHETAPSELAWSPQGELLYFIADDPKSEEEKRKDKAKDDVFAFDENYQQEHLWSVRPSDAKAQRITEGDFSILSYSVSRDGSRIAFHRAPTPLFDDSDESEVWVMSAQGQDARKLTDNGVNESGAALSPDNRTVLFVSGSNSEFETYYNDNLFLVPAAGGPHQMLLQEMPYEVQRAAWSEDGQSIFFLANMGLRNELFQVEVASQKLTQLSDGMHSLGSWTYSPAGGHVFLIAQPDNPGEVWVLGKDGPQRVSRVFKNVSEDFLLPRQERFAWKGQDGQEVEGLLFYPLDYQEGRRYPLAVQTHGGPASSDKYGFPRWSNYIPRLAALGYAVFKPNYRGSTGYGDDFLRDMVGHYFQNAHLDVMSGVDALIEKGIADPEQMVKMGWSAGGHMTNKIITFTNRFKAASSGAGAVNWVSMYAQSDVRIYRTPWFGGTPWQKDAPVDIYWQNSPLRDIWKVKTPTLVLVGENDVRVPSPQSVELYRALKANGVPTHLYIAPREPHGWRELRHQLFKMNVELEWFEKYARNREYEWETPPGE